MGKIKKSQACWACKTEHLAIEMHHYPTPKLYSGNEVIPMCLNCHEYVSRKLLRDWPDWIWAQALNWPDDAPLGAKLVFLKFVEKLLKKEWSFEIDFEETEGS